MSSGRDWPVRIATEGGANWSLAQRIQAQQPGFLPPWAGQRGPAEKGEPGGGSQNRRESWPRSPKAAVPSRGSLSLMKKLEVPGPFLDFANN